jgi:hypothetical protein
MSLEAHQKAKVLTVTNPEFTIYSPNPGESAGVRHKIRQGLKERSAYNEQVKTNLGIEFEFTYLGFKPSEYDSTWHGDTWQVTGKGDFTLTFRRGAGNRTYYQTFDGASVAVIIPPSAMDILHCAYLDDPHDESFEDWCLDLGYDPDSRKAEKSYNACIQQTMMFRRNYPGVNLDDYEPLQNF